MEDTQTSVPVGNQTTVNNTSSALASDNIEAVEAAVVAERQRVLDLEALDDGQNAAITAIIKRGQEKWKNC